MGDQRIKEEKIKKAVEKYQNKMAELRKRRLDLFRHISEKSDQQKINIIMKKLKNK